LQFAVGVSSQLACPRAFFCAEALEAIGMQTSLTDPALWHRIHFGFTITYHYLFPQLTMGLAWFLVYWKWRALRTGDEKYNRAARFWARIFGLNCFGSLTHYPKAGA
jgi:hypothetical protein